MKLADFCFCCPWKEVGAGPRCEGSGRAGGRGVSEGKGESGLERSENGSVPDGQQKGKERYLVRRKQGGGARELTFQSCRSNIQHFICCFHSDSWESLVF